MSSFDPNHPQGAPHDPPGYGASGPQGYGAPGYDPAPSYSGAPAGYGGGSGRRPGPATGAAIVGIVIGALGTLGGLLSLSGLSVIFGFDAFLGLLSLLSIAVAVVLLVGGIQTLTGKSPTLLLYGSYASLISQLLYVIWAAVSGWGFPFLGVLGFILPVVIIALLMQPQVKQYYAARGQRY